MRAIQVTKLDGPPATELVEMDEPAPSQDIVIVDVEAAGMSFPEVLLSRGLYQVKPEPTFVPGSETAGAVRGYAA
jgi:NADPH:quinone reductase